ncbi:NAD-dependent epimerase/dehydratase family protein [Geodermatophilus sp. DF01-2]|uniref:NAD-dependent epimerase/dehydratase family protein n=1 Tax=Geodermatophilus sp. DF01-2 TaxID=2559610 RepID=UPI0010731197|nr:NAD-dependent epimerase/dehydratase family protein [Geodermatophilus sp. DF01_2]TFV56256.1 NAD-dependent epimerase/dehydratase family protein [Geodermatophilus sp. DF01_2]
MRLLVTGASGMLGRATAEGLLARGDEVTVLQRRPAGLPCREVLGDVADPSVVRRAARGQDAVLHLAAKVDVTGQWTEYAHANIDGTRTVLDACRAEDVGRLVHVSSPSVAHAGTALVGVGAEPADPASARGRYSRSKAVAELDALAADSTSLAVLALRPHLVWGPGDPQLVARIVERARAGRLPVVGSGTALIDTTYVDNAAAALVAAVDACGPVHGEALVVSNGEPRPVAEVLARLCRAAGVPGPRGRVPFGAAYVAGAAMEGIWAVTRRRSVPPLTRFLAEQLATAHWFDQRRTRTALRWRPRVGLDDGFSRLAAWYAAAGPPPRGMVRTSR